MKSKLFFSINQKILNKKKKNYFIFFLTKLPFNRQLFFCSIFILFCFIIEILSSFFCELHRICILISFIANLINALCGCIQINLNPKYYMFRFRLSTLSKVLIWRWFQRDGKIRTTEIFDRLTRISIRSQFIIEASIPIY